MAAPIQQLGLRLQDTNSDLPLRLQQIAAQQPVPGDSIHRFFSDILAKLTTHGLRQYGSPAGVTHYSDQQSGAFVVVWLHSDIPAHQARLLGDSKVRALSALRFNRDRGTPTSWVYAIITVPWSIRILRVTPGHWADITRGVCHSQQAHPCPPLSAWLH